MKRDALHLRGNRSLWCVLAALLLLSGAAQVACGQEAQWIWSPEHPKDSVPAGACHFRKILELNTPSEGKVMITADDTYELYVNGRRVGVGELSKKLAEYDISRHLTRGTNVVAVKVVNQRGRTAALAARVMIKDGDRQWRTFSTDPSWRTNLRPLPLWNTTFYNDRRWDVAQSFGKLGDTVPWDRAENVAIEQRERGERFSAKDEFEVRRIVDGENVGSLIAMTFNEFGHIIVSEEGGPLLLIQKTKAGGWGAATTYCNKVKNCQGILALNGDVYVTGDGPDGQALYRLSDRNRDGLLEDVHTLLRFKGSMGEHGVHGVTLGPDGWLYVMVGNHASLDGQYDKSSPHYGFYEGDLVGPRYEDPTGHAAGIAVPGGVILRTDLQGQHVELFAGGIRNAYDLVFTREGDLLVHDSDMESDEGAPWYRPTQIFHAVPGGEYGWRSGWAKWPDYYVDSLPAVIDTGRGSPTGAVIYDHSAFPKRYHNAMFTADWSLGRILAVRLRPNGASYTADSEVFIEGSPLNVTDLDVGPDGSLYFVTGGRGTGGGIYRVTWKGTVPEAVRNLGEGISVAIRQPQLQSAWARQEIATLREQIGAAWGKQLVGVARSTANPPHYRTRALDLMQLFGPPPESQLLVLLSRDKSEIVRAKAAELMGLHADPETNAALLELLSDGDRHVRRRACEALCRAGHKPPVQQVLNLVAADDRMEAWAARRLLERLPVEKWRDMVLESENPRVFVNGALALMIADPNRDNALSVVNRFQEHLEGFVSDRDFVDMLRVTQVALHLGQLEREDVPQLAELLAAEFPAGHPQMNRELVRLLVHLRVTAPADRYFAYLESNASHADKLHLALHMRFLAEDLETTQKFQLLNYYEQAQQVEGGGSYAHYIRNVARDFARTLSPDEAADVLARGDQWPSAALGALYSLPEQLDDATRDQLIALDQRLPESPHPDVARALGVGLVAVLARCGDEDCMEYLRQVWEADPERRPAVAMGLAQSPDGENWSYLVRSLPLMDGPGLREVVQQMLSVAKAPAEPEYIRQLILAGHRLGDQGAEDALALLEYWTGEQPADVESDWQAQMDAWTQWFAQQHPELPAAELPVADEDSKWKLDELLTYLGSDDAAQFSSSEGAAVFAKAQCSKCHRMGSTGETVGPDLTTLAKRFTRKEVLQSILFPSHVISDQYGTKVVVTKTGKTYTGMVVPVGDNAIVVLQNDGRKIELSNDDVEQLEVSNKSAMPEGLLNDLSQEEIAQLFAYLGFPAPQRWARSNQEREAPAVRQR